MTNRLNRVHPETARVLLQANVGETPNPKHITFSTRDFLALAAQDGAESIRAHFGVAENGTTTVLFTAVDAEGQDIINTYDPIVIGIGRPCPPFCGGTGDEQSFLYKV